jgi:carbamoyltransferase
MIILGINEDHNATAAIVKDGVVLSCASEERFSRVKNDTGYPKKAIESVLSSAGISSSEIDYAVYSSKEFDAQQMKIKRVTTFKISDYIREMNEYWKPVLLEKKGSDFWSKISKEARFSDLKTNHYDLSFLESSPKEKWDELSKKARIDVVTKHLGLSHDRIKFMDHHTGHAHYAYFASPHNLSERAAVVTVDGWGDGCNATISIVENGRLKEVHRTAMCNIGRIYRWMTLLLAMKPNEHEFKVMGLAPYARDYIKKPAYEVFKKTLVVKGLDFEWNEKPSDMYFYFKEKLDGMRFDGIAAGVQQWVEDLLCEWISNIMKKFETDTLYLSGGVAMNVKANKAIAELDCVRKFYVSPSGGDESLAIGAAFALASAQGESLKPLKNAYLGDAVFVSDSKDLIKKYLKDGKHELIENPTNDLLAGLLASGKVLARCCGRMEFGARALGNRSILCDPSKQDNIRIINEKIKFRDFWMPFTPSILAERADDYIVNPKGLEAPYMALAFDSTELARKHIIAAIHPYDFTIRPQLVTAETNHDYYHLIKAFQKKTGIGSLLNTSFNLHGFPIVRTVEDAYEAFEKSGLDGLIIPGFLILKK